MPIPPEISADQAAGIPAADVTYRCPDCDLEFFKLATMEEHWYFEHSGLAVDKDKTSE